MKKEIKKIESCIEDVVANLGIRMHRNSYVGHGRRTAKGRDIIAEYRAILKELNIPFKAGNDAPKGGFSGEFILVAKNQRGKLTRFNVKDFMLQKLWRDNLIFAEKNMSLFSHNQKMRNTIMLFHSNQGFEDHSKSGNSYRWGQKPNPTMVEKGNIPDGLERINLSCDFEVYSSKHKRWVSKGVDIK